MTGVRGDTDEASNKLKQMPAEDERLRKNPKSNAATGASAASIRTLSSQVVAFYFRAPAKAFFRTRVDWLAYAKAINPRVQAHERWSWRLTTPGLLAHAVKVHGWGFIPNQVLPPMVANVGIGAILYTSYLQILGSLHEPSAKSTKRIYPPPSLEATFKAGFIAGTIQSTVAAPLDALQVRYTTNDMMASQYKSMWQYSWNKLRDIGVRGVFAGWGLSFLKDSFGCGVFFATFEYIKAQSYYAFVTRYYGSLLQHAHPFRRRSPDANVKPDIRPHYSLEPIFLLFAGVSASITQQLVQHPLTLLQTLHYNRLPSLDEQIKLKPTPVQMLKAYHQAYQVTIAHSQSQALRADSWRKWMYRGFLFNTLRQVPSTSAGLIVFELVRRKHGSEVETTRVQKDGYDIILS